MTEIPDFMPVLSAGGHGSPEEGACVMEYVSILAGEPFSDTPKCTSYSLGSLAITVNDWVADANRYLLVPLIGRLIGTAAVETPEAKAYVRARHGAAIQPDNHLSNFADAAKVQYLTDTLDGFDRLSGHTPQHLDDDALRQLAAAVG